MTQLPNRRATLLAAAVVLAVAGCGGAEEPADGDATGAAPTAGGGSGAASAGAAGGAAGSALRGTLGTPDNPNAFEIGLVDASGAEVGTLRPGTYTLEVDDQTEIHNFHLTGEGVDVETGVSETGKKTFTITLQAGEYRYVCDPHPNMQGTLTVSA